MNDRPRLQTSTLWYHPSQQYGDTAMGRPGYTGRTPSYVIANLLERYTREGDLVVDPFCGGGTTLDVADEMQRKSRGFDLQPQHERVEEGDARSLPLKDGSVDFVSMDPPYSDHLEYSGKDACIGKLDAFEPAYFEALREVFVETKRVLGNRRYMAVYVGDSFKKKRGFVGIGARLFVMLEELFRPIDHVSVVRGNRNLEKGRFHSAAAEGNYFLRGYNHLLIFKKED